MKKRIFKILSTVLAVIMSLSLVLFSACDNTDKNANAKVAKMQIGTKPTKMEYLTGELFDPTGMTLLVQYDNGNTAEITEGYTWDIKDPLTEDDDEITITYRNKSILIEIDITIRVPTTLEVANPETAKTEYEVGQKFDKTKLQLKATYEDGSSEIVTSGFRVSPSGRLTREDTKVTITYNKAKLELPILVKSPHVTELKVTTQPTKVAYTEGEYFDTTGMVVKAVYSDETEAVVADYDYSPKTQLTTDVTKIVVSYGEFTVDVPVTVNQAAKALFVTTNPSKTSYAAGENFDATGMVVTLREYGSPTVLSSSDYTVTGGENLAVGSAVTVTLKSDTSVKTTVPVLISDEIDVTKDMLWADSQSKIDAMWTANHATLGKYAVNGNYSGNYTENSTLTVVVPSATAGKAGITIKASSTWVTEYSTTNIHWPIKTSSVQANLVFEVYVNGVKVPIADSVMITGGETSNQGGDVSLLAQWSYIKLANVDFIADDNEIKLVFLEQIYKNADVTDAANGQVKEGVLSSPFIDTVKVAFGECVSHKADTAYAQDANNHWQICQYCGDAINVTAHAYDNEVAEAKYFAEEADCINKAKYYKSCDCGIKGTETFEYGNVAGHQYEDKAADGEHWQECSVCHNKTAATSQHTYAVTGAEANGTQSIALQCACGAKIDKSMSMSAATYVNLTTDHVKGNNTEQWAIDAGRGTAQVVATSTSGISSTVQLSTNASHNSDYVRYLYGGSRIEVALGATADTTGMVVVKASSGYLSYVSWPNYTASDMQFNKVFKAYIRHSDNTTTAITIDDSAILKGAQGGYEVLANWSYIAFTGLTVKAGDTFVLESLAPKKADNSDYLYKDYGSDGTQSTPTVDTVAIYLG